LLEIFLRKNLCAHMIYLWK